MEVCSDTVTKNAADALYKIGVTCLHRGTAFHVSYQKML